MVQKVNHFHKSIYINIYIHNPQIIKNQHPVPFEFEIGFAFHQVISGDAYQPAMGSPGSVFCTCQWMEDSRNLYLDVGMFEWNPACLELISILVCRLP